MQETENLEYKEVSNWDEHLQDLHEILNKVEALDNSVHEQERSSKLV